MRFWGAEIAGEGKFSPSLSFIIVYSCKSYKNSPDIRFFIQKLVDKNQKNGEDDILKSYRRIS
jgi:hypothetical protein